MSSDFQREIRFLGMTSSPAFVRQPECNGVAEGAIRTLKEQLLWPGTAPQSRSSNWRWLSLRLSTKPAGCVSDTGTRRSNRSARSRGPLKPKPVGGSNWRYKRRKARSQKRAPVRAVPESRPRALLFLCLLILPQHDSFEPPCRWHLFWQEQDSHRQQGLGPAFWRHTGCGLPSEGCLPGPARVGACRRPH